MKIKALIIISLLNMAAGACFLKLYQSYQARKALASVEMIQKSSLPAALDHETPVMTANYSGGTNLLAEESSNGLVQHYFVQLGAFQMNLYAERLTLALKKKGYTTKISQRQLKHMVLNVVELGPFKREKDAKEIGLAVAKEFGLGKVSVIRQVED